MKNILRITLLASLFLFSYAHAQTGTWTWVRGDSAGTSVSYGVQGIPSSTNNPPQFYAMAQWTDTTGNFWLLTRGDLWKYDPLVDMWTWMKGIGTINDSGHYGTYRVPSPLNRPHARHAGVATWTDHDNNLWLFGGVRSGSTSCIFLGDLWKYNIATNEWTWMHGTSGCNTPPIWGTKGVPSPTNRPRGRSETTCSWIDSNGNLWMFGGSVGPSCVYNDLWRYDVTTNEWTWMSGDSICSAQTVHGTQGVAASTNNPGGRCSYAHWIDSNDDLWLFGGYILTPQYNATMVSDFWKYSISTGMWTWMGGSNQILDYTNHYGTQGVPSPSNQPRTRTENRASWVDSCGNFWMFGGLSMDTTTFTQRYLNDLWKYELSTGNWAWIGGDSTYGSAAVYGQMGVGAPANKPNCVNGSSSWVDKQGNLWMMGGYGIKYPSNQSITGNVLWKYTLSCENENPKGVTENVTPETPRIYPNPAGDELHVEMNQNISFDRAVVVNMSGKIVLEVSSQPGNVINIRSLAEGMYTLQLFDGAKQTGVAQFTVKR